MSLLGHEKCLLSICFAFTTVGYIFSKYVHCDMRFLVEKISALLCFLDGFGVAVPVFSYYKHPSWSLIV